MPQKDEIARDLATRHFEVEPGLTNVFRLRSESETQISDPIKLLEVNEGTISAGVMPLFFSPTSGIPFPSVIVEVTPNEFARIQARELLLPQGWTLGEELHRPVLTQAG